jgi:LysM repeat protein
MRVTRHRWLPIAALSCAVAVLGAACSGDSGHSGDEPDLEAIPTATLPAQLPEVRILGSSAVIPGGATYTVKANDTLSSIASLLGVSLEDLMAANPGVDSSSLSIGQVLVVPQGGEPQPTPAAEPTEEPDDPTPTTEPEPVTTPSSLGQTYTVQSGDIPVTIAERFGITVEELLAANPGIDPRGLQVGDVLIIPAPAATPTPEPPAEAPSPAT